MTRDRSQNEAWAQIERDKQIDRVIRRVAIVAWAVTLAIVAVFAVATAWQLLEMWQAVREGGLPRGALVGSAIPLFTVLGYLSVLIAVMATVAIFLRLRTSSLAEIQLRLAALEDMLGSERDGDRPGAGH